MDGVASAIGDVLPAAVGVALSPLPIAAVVLLLVTGKGLGRPVAFVVGWVGALEAVGNVVVLVLGDDAADAGSTTSDGIGWGKVVLGVLLLGLAVRSWRGRPRAGEEPETPTWMSSLDGFSVPKAFAAGVVLAAVNPKNLTLALAASASVASAGLDGGGDVAAISVFVVIASIGVAAPVVLVVASGERAEPRLEAMRGWLVANNHTILAIVLVLLGAKVLGDGLGLLG